MVAGLPGIGCAGARTGWRMGAVVDKTAQDAVAGDKRGFELERFLPYRLTVLASVTAQALSQIYAGHDIGIPEWRILVTLGERGTMTGKAVGRHTRMHKTKVSRAVASLEKRKLIARQTNRDDLREAFLSLTPAGRAVYNDLVPKAVAFANQLLMAVDPADRPALERALTVLTARCTELANPDDRG
jgi:DNA-binding MarR family transcriptional regulator